MNSKDFSVFRILLTELYSKAFGEPLSDLPYGKAQALRWIIHDTTGNLLSYKSLRNYVSAAIENKPDRVNPSEFTLSTLVRFISEDNDNIDVRECVAWYKYRKEILNSIAL
jgi:hypothetical protein